MKKLIIIIALALVAAAAGLTTCHSSNKPYKRLDQSVPIEFILSSPQSYAGKTISIKGTVSESMGVFGHSWFVLTDHTGSIHVHGKHYYSPSEGEKIKVEGTVKQRFRFNDYNGIVFQINNN